ncbi:hypothetical protein ILUMI_05289 [Ignelater luminosus]|uniref:U3 small nucleolar RNA-associated protein 11 n=1 Tax=Ignelater luminosus TaxID=2038154 RepID=A0A8K0GI84_IGNLU|nr:hypothetical protein ILUMI_05289 [Ignelater luminosus]
MSVWKKTSKLNQKTHRERHQPEDRKHLGLLEKHKDYVKRATDYNEKKETLRLLQKRALNKNPDEFYYHMINSKIDKGRHHERETEQEDTPEQIQLMRTQDLKYINLKRTQESKKIERLQAQLHLSSVNHQVKNKHIYFPKNHEKVDQKNGAQDLEFLANVELPDVDVEALKEVSKKRKHMYIELGKRVKREKELSVIQQKIQIKKHLENKKNTLKPTRVKKGYKDSAPVYKWKYERKR